MNNDEWVRDHVRSHNMGGFCFYKPSSRSSGKFVTIILSDRAGSNFNVEFGTYEGSIGTNPNEISDSLFRQESEQEFKRVEEMIQFLEENLGFNPFEENEK